MFAIWGMAGPPKVLKACGVIREVPQELGYRVVRGRGLGPTRFVAVGRRHGVKILDRSAFVKSVDTALELRLMAMGLNADQLESAQRKLMRGIEHVETLRGETRAFENGGAYVFESERKSRSAQEVEYRCFAIQRKEMPSHWPLLAGEAIQCLRSALDHFIYAASGRNRRTQFPIFTDACEFQVLSPRMMKGVPKAMRTSIERAQPYRCTPSAPAQDPLAQLNSLSNLDKHRVLAAFASAVTNEGVGVPDGVNLSWEEFGTDKHLGPGKTYVSTLVAHTEGSTENMDVQPMFAYEVRIEGRPINVLVWIAKRVFRTLAECDAGKPLPPFAPYPI